MSEYPFWKRRGGMSNIFPSLVGYKRSNVFVHSLVGETADKTVKALVIGSSTLLSPEVSLHLANLNFLSPNGCCYSFDAHANGYGRGEGVVALYLKPLRRAVHDGDVVRAIVRATASNQDGRTPGLTQPSSQAQVDLIKQTYAKAGLKLNKTRYVEAHGE